MAMLRFTGKSPLQRLEESLNQYTEGIGQIKQTQMGVGQELARRQQERDWKKNIDTTLDPVYKAYDAYSVLEDALNATPDQTTDEKGKVVQTNTEMKQKKSMMEGMLRREISKASVNLLRGGDPRNVTIANSLDKLLPKQASELKDWSESTPFKATDPTSGKEQMYVRQRNSVTGEARTVPLNLGVKEKETEQQKRSGKSWEDSRKAFEKLEREEAGIGSTLTARGVNLDKVLTKDYSIPMKRDRRTGKDVPDPDITKYRNLNQQKNIALEQLGKDYADLTEYKTWRNKRDKTGKSPETKQTEKDKFVVGKVYQDASGNKAKYLGDGKWESQ